MLPGSLLITPSPSHDDGSHAILVAAGEKMLVGDGLRPRGVTTIKEVSAKRLRVKKSNRKFR